MNFTYKSKKAVKTILVRIARIYKYKPNIINKMPSVYFAFERYVSRFIGISVRDACFITAPYS